MTIRITPVLITENVQKLISSGVKLWKIRQDQKKGIIGPVKLVRVTELNR